MATKFANLVVFDTTGGRMSTVEVMANLAAALEAADRSGKIAPDSECWITFNLTPIEYDAIRGDDEQVNAEEGFREQILYKSDLIHLEAVLDGA
jgi:hypothetical protein